MKSYPVEIEVKVDQIAQVTMCSAESTPDPNGSTTTSTSTTTKTPDTTIRNPNRRSNKPIMEKRRRARINNCLNELKSILLEAMRKDPARHSKLEKADILELTVSHLKALHRAGNSVNDVNSSRFRQGFAECAAEVGRFLASVKPESADPAISGRLLNHLADCLQSPLINNNNNNNNHLTHNLNHGPPPPGGIANVNNCNNSIISLVPSRLSSGEIAFVVPGYSHSHSPNSHHPSHTNPPVINGKMSFQMQNPPPMLSPEVPLELTVTSSHSSGDSSSSSSMSISPNYPIGGQYHNQPHHQSIYQMHNNNYHPYHQVNDFPLNFSKTPKREISESDSCWRPW